MPKYDEIEPTPLSVDKIKSLPADRPVLILSLMRLRRDLAEGRAEAAFNQWQREVGPILDEYGVTRLLTARISFPLVATAGADWDVVGLFTYPTPKALWRFISDLRVLELLKIRRLAADDVRMVVLEEGDPVALF